MECQHEVAHRVFLGTVERESRASLPSCYGAHELLPESLGGRCKLIELGTAEGRVSDSYRGGPAIAEMIAAAHVSGMVTSPTTPLLELSIRSMYQSCTNSEASC